MLLRKYGGRHKIDNLLSVTYRLECRAHGNLRLSEANVAAQKSVHYLGALHILLRLRNRGKLVIRFLIREHLLELLLPYRVRSELIALPVLPYRIQLNKLLCNSRNRALYLRLGLRPLNSSQLIKLRLVSVRP